MLALKRWVLRKFEPFIGVILYAACALWLLHVDPWPGFGPAVRLLSRGSAGEWVNDSSRDVLSTAVQLTSCSRAGGKAATVGR